MLMPKKVKFRKQHRGRRAGMSKGGDYIAFGDFGLQVLEPGWITARQIEAARVAISRAVKKSGKIYVRLFPDKSFTKKPAETRMGTGKGAVEGWVAVVRPGRVIFEVEGVDAATAKSAFTRAHHKLPIRTAMVARGSAL
mgnify:CR=1 FL=1